MGKKSREKRERRQALIEAGYSLSLRGMSGVHEHLVHEKEPVNPIV
jgi:hypothetical protein